MQREQHQQLQAIAQQQEIQRQAMAQQQDALQHEKQQEEARNHQDEMRRQQERHYEQLQEMRQQMQAAQEEMQHEQQRQLEQMHEQQEVQRHVLLAQQQEMRYQHEEQMDQLKQEQRRQVQMQQVQQQQLQRMAQTQHAVAVEEEQNAPPTSAQFNAEKKYLRTSEEIVSDKRREIDALYRKHNPSKLGEVDNLVAKYGEEKFLAMARKKYLKFRRSNAPSVPWKPTSQKPPDPNPYNDGPRWKDTLRGLDKESPPTAADLAARRERKSPRKDDDPESRKPKPNPYQEPVPFSDTLRAPSPEDDVAEHPPSKPVEMQSASSYRASVDNARSRIAEQVRADRARYRAQQGKADSWDVDAAVPRDMSAVPAPRMEDPAGLRAAAARMAAEAQAEVDEETQPVGGRLLHAQRVARARGMAAKDWAQPFDPVPTSSHRVVRLTHPCPHILACMLKPESSSVQAPPRTAGLPVPDSDGDGLYPEPATDPDGDGLYPESATRAGPAYGSRLDDFEEVYVQAGSRAHVPASLYPPSPNRAPSAKRREQEAQAAEVVDAKALAAEAEAAEARYFARASEQSATIGNLSATAYIPAGTAAQADDTAAEEGEDDDAGDSAQIGGRIVSSGIVQEALREEARVREEEGAAQDGDLAEPPAVTSADLDEMERREPRMRPQPRDGL